RGHFLLSASAALVWAGSSPLKQNQYETPWGQRTSGTSGAKKNAGQHKMKRMSFKRHNRHQLYRGGACPGPCSTNPYLDPSCFAPILSGPIDVVVPAGPGVRRVVDAGAFVVDALSIVPALRSFYAAAAVSTVVAVFVSPATVALLGVGVMAVQLGLLLLFLLRVALAVKGGGKGQGKGAGGGAWWSRGGDGVPVLQGPTVVVVGPRAGGERESGWGAARRGAKAPLVV
ncbi:LOW QUALITY PROTEIN: hypothetical protein CRUP_018269, partial [Coryphaenoides rupestris]